MVNVRGVLLENTQIESRVGGENNKDRKGLIRETGRDNST
jgi:hypothetical protein